MRSAVRWMAQNHVAANLLMLVLILGGLIKGLAVKQEIFPEVSLDTIQVSVAYPGAGPEEVEEGILQQIEENLSSVDGIKQIKSVAAEGVGTVSAEINAGEDADRILQDIKSEVDRIITFPEDAEKPVITKLLNRREVISVVVYGDLPERSLREQAEDIRDELLTIPNITQVDLGGVRPYEISIEVPEENLRRYNLTLEQVAQRVRQASLDLPGGTIKTSGGEILLRTKERRYYGPGYEQIDIIVRPDGTRVKLGDIATVKDAFQETDLFARFDGQPAAMVKVFRVGDQKPTQMSKAVIDYIEQKKASLPASVHIAYWNDTSEMLRSRTNLLLKNAAFGLILVFIVLGLFLEIRLSLWVMLGIPISFLGALFVMPMMDVSINMVSLFAFILALGILVDDAIVIGENIYEHRQLGKPYMQAAIDGALEVAVPVTFSILTTVAAFVPIIFVEGMMGKFMRVIPLVVIALLLVSLVESLFVLPAHLALGRRRELSGGVFGAIERNRRRFGTGMERFIRGPYRRLLDLCISYRYATLALGIAVLLLAFGIVRGGILKFTFMPEVDGDVITASLEMPRGTPVTETDRIQQLIVEQGMAVIADYDRDRPAGNSILRNIYAVVGGTVAGGGPAGGKTTTSSHLADIAMFLKESGERGVSSTEIEQHWRQRVGEIPGIKSLTFKSNLVRLGANIDVALAHKDFQVLEKATARVSQALAAYPAVGDLADSYAKGKQEIKFHLKPEASTLGITEESLGRQLRSAFYGAEALRLQRGRNEVKVMVRWPEDDRKSLWDLANLRIRTPDGGEIPLSRAATIEEGLGFSEINRTDQKRVVNITAQVDNKKGNAGEILEDIKNGVLSQLRHDYPGLTYDLEGEEKERRQSLGSLKEGFLLALVAIYALLAIPFRSYSQPLLIMTAIPFGLVGAIAGHLIMGYNLSMLSIFGIVALAGVVVNDSLLLIDRVNQNRREGAGLKDALLEAGQRRFRPILLTSLTTFFGLAPMIMETSVQARFLIPMAISLGFGIMFATGITLILIPSLYLVLEDVRALFGLPPDHADHRPPTI